MKVSTGVRITINGEPLDVVLPPILPVTHAEIEYASKVFELRMLANFIHGPIVGSKILNAAIEIGTRNSRPTLDVAEEILRRIPSYEELCRSVLENIQYDHS